MSYTHPPIVSIPGFASRLRKDRIGLFPCDTIWGLLAAFTPAGFSRLAALKQRPNQPFVVLSQSLDAALRLMARPTQKQLVMLEAYWPGTVTFILNKHSSVSDELTCGCPTLALRVPKWEPLYGLLSLYNGYVYSTSANFHGQPEPTSFDTIDTRLYHDVACIYNELEPPAPRQASTIVDLTVDPPVVVRQGAQIFE